jgi:hypothetical protein
MSFVAFSLTACGKGRPTSTEEKEKGGRKTALAGTRE